MINRHNWSVFLIGISFILSACQGQHEDHFQNQSAELEIGDSFFKRVYSIDGRTFTVKTISLHKVVERQKRHLLENDVINFWKVIHEEQVDKWAAGYLMPVKSERTALTHWVIKLSLNEATLATSGGGAFPSDNNYLTPVGPDPGKRFKRVATAFKGLQLKNSL